MTHRILETTSVHPTKGYSHAARAGNKLFIAGKIAKDVDDNLVGPADFPAQAHQVYSNLRNEYFRDPMPPNTLVVIESLASPEFLIEVEAIAVVD